MTTPEGAAPLDVLERERQRLTGLAYRVTGSLADAKDIVQEAWLRWVAADPADIANPAGWLTTLTSRVALDHLRSQRRRREVYLGPWLPDAVATLPPPRRPPCWPARVPWASSSSSTGWARASAWRSSWVRSSASPTP